MTELQTILYSLINWSEGLAAVIALFHFKQLKNTYWKWFVIYVVFIATMDIFGDFGLDFFPSFRKIYYDFFIIPVEFLFMYWIYAKKSLKFSMLFWISCIIYIFFFVLHFFNLYEIRYVSSMSYTVGVFLLAIMIYLEFIKQIKSDEILTFKSNKMFYINIAVMFFYIGTLPFFSFDKYLFENAKELWSNYYTFFLLSDNTMYLLFAASFIWGKQKL